MDGRTACVGVPSRETLMHTLDEVVRLREEPRSSSTAPQLPAPDGTHTRIGFKSG
jgi:hypothetical protein